MPLEKMFHKLFASEGSSNEPEKLECYFIDFLIEDGKLEKLVNNYAAAHRRSVNLHERFRKDKAVCFKPFNEKVQKGLNEGKFVRASTLPHLNKLQKHYLPVNIAYSDGKSSQRPITDGSHPSGESNLSLNACMPHGYTSDNLLSSVLYSRSMAFVSFLDLKSAYWNVRLKDKSASLCRLILRLKPGTNTACFGEEGKGEFVEMVCLVLSFGICQASSILRTVIIRAANEFLEPDSEAKTALTCYTYVDDVVCGGNYEASRTLVKKKIGTLFNTIG